MRWARIGEKLAVGIDVKIDERSAQITMSGPFRFDVHQHFESAYSPLLDNAEIHQIMVELSKVDYMDCSALGMLLLLNERAKLANKKVALLANSDMVSGILQAANFGGIFDIEHAAPVTSATQNISL